MKQRNDQSTVEVLADTYYCKADGASATGMKLVDNIAVDIVTVARCTYTQMCECVICKVHLFS